MDPKELSEKTFDNAYDMIRYIIQTDQIDPGPISDGHHTFSELYNHRNALFLILARFCGKNAWKSKCYFDETLVQEGWFLAGVFPTPGAQISYHLPMSLWNQTDFIQELNKAPLWDGHTSEEVVQRLHKIPSTITVTEHRTGRHTAPDDNSKPPGQ